MEPKELRWLSRRMTGVAMVTARDAAGELRGLTGKSFTSISLEPPLVFWSISREAQTFESFAKGAEFAIHVLEHNRENFQQRLAKTGGTKFEDIDFSITPSGTALLDGTTATVICAAHLTQAGGDHLIILGRVSQIIVVAQSQVFADGMLQSLIERLLKLESAQALCASRSLMGASIAEITEVEGRRESGLSKWNSFLIREARSVFCAWPGSDPEAL
jgi:flavin reductase (DIM6/NTAB) family NADH-FMN oxidoreductase RutF